MAQSSATGSQALRHWRILETNTSPAARELLNRVDLHVPISVPANGLRYPIRRLVVTGEDTPETMELLFGPIWEVDAKSCWEETRGNMLLNWPIGGVPNPAYFRNLDPTAPKWTPKGPSDEDEMKIQQVGDLKRLSMAMGM